MSDYRPPVSDVFFVLEHVVGYPDIAKLPGYQRADLDTVVDLLQQCADFMVDVVAPTNVPGDVEGSHCEPDGTVVRAVPGEVRRRRIPLVGAIDALLHYGDDEQQRLLPAEDGPR